MMNKLIELKNEFNKAEQLTSKSYDFLRAVVE